MDGEDQPDVNSTLTDIETLEWCAIMDQDGPKTC